MFNTSLNIKPAFHVFLQNFDLILANIRQIFVKTYKHYGPSTPHRSGPSSSKTVREKQGNHREGLPDPGQGRGGDVYATSRLHELNSKIRTIKKYFSC